MNNKVDLHAAHLISNLPDEAFIKLPTVLLLLKVCKSHWYAGIKNGIYPQPVKINSGSRWVLGEIRATQRMLKDNRNNTAIGRWSK